MDCSNVKKQVVIILACMSCFISVFWLDSFIKCEILTSLHEDEFKNGYLTTGVLDKPKYYKVINYSQNHAKVYYVDKNSGSILYFYKIDTKWYFDKWSTVWSLTGTADDMVWPYLWDSVKGKFSIIAFLVPTTIMILLIMISLYKKRTRKRSEN